MQTIETSCFFNPNIDIPIEDIWAYLEKKTDEIFITDDKSRREDVTVNFLLPPLFNGKKKVKGLLVSRAVDYLHTNFSEIRESFITIANSMAPGFAKSQKADAYFALYDNEERIEWFKKNNPKLAKRIFLPYQDADIANEEALLPVACPKDIDILMIARIAECKNIDLFLKSLIHIDQKYGLKLKATIIVGSKLTEATKNTDLYKKLIDIAGSEYRLHSYIQFIETVPYGNIYQWYSRAKITAFTSILEGKNRVIQESLFCNTPVICFADYNKYIRGKSPILPEGCAYYVEENTAEAFGEKLYSILKNPENINYSTREIALKHYNRAMSVDKIIKSIPYYHNRIPKLFDGPIIENEFVNKCVYNKLGISYYDFLYKQNPSCTYRVHEGNSLYLNILAN